MQTRLHVSDHSHATAAERRYAGRFCRTGALAVLLALNLTAAHAATLIDLDATGQPTGPLGMWPNTGTLAGDFYAWMDAPEVVTVDGVNAVSFRGGTPGLQGTSYYGPNAPETICGGASRTIEAWIWDPAPQEEKTIFAWGHRGGPEGSNCTFGHGTHPVWGCLGGWGYADLGYSNTLVFSRWVYVVYTYDAATLTARAYQDGVLSSTEVYTGRPLITWTNDASGFPIPFRVARQTDANGNPSDAGVGTNLIAKIRVHDVALTPEQVQARFDAEKAQFGLVDSDSDGMPDWYERRYGLNPQANDAGADGDQDGLSNLAEYQKGTIPTDADTDDDGLKDGVETNTGVWVSATDTGTDPLLADTDGDGLLDGVETNTGVFVSAANTGTNPLLKDTDADTYDDYGEVVAGSDPNSAASIPNPGNWVQEVTRSNPKYWYRFEQTDPGQTAVNSGSAGAAFDGYYGPGITAGDFVGSVVTVLGNALQFTGPAANNATPKYVDLGQEIPELTNFRPPAVDKTTTVEYWIRTSQSGTHGNNTWQSPSILAHESPGDGDMYWGNINSSGDFIFSTSDLHDCHSIRDAGRDVTDGQWHHIVLVKEWHVSSPCVSTMYIDGGALEGGATIIRNTAAGNASYQDTDSGIRYIGFTQAGELDNVQFIGQLDEVAIYDRALSPTEVRTHFRAVYFGDTDGDGMPDAWENSHGLNWQVNDAAGDPDNDGSTNLQEYLRKTNPQDADSDDDGLKDGVETNTGTWTSANDRGTDPLNPDTDADGLLDGVESNTGVFVSLDDTGSSPLRRDTDGDSYTDRDEAALGFDPSSAASHPTVPASYVAAVTADKPIHWLRFEETTTAGGVANLGSAAPAYTVVFGAGITDADLGKPGAYPGLGRAMEFTGPAANNTTTKYVDFGQPVPELVNLRQDSLGNPIEMEEGKATTVEYWFKTTQTGSNGNNTWQNPSIMAHESPYDGDMYWGNINAAGDFIFSTSDLHDAHITNRVATDGQWHHVVMTKIWHTNSPCITRLYLDGGADIGGRTIETTTPAGATSGQDFDGQIQYIGFTQSGELGNVQFIGQLDEVAIYTNAFVEAQARLHYLAARNSAAVTLQYQIVSGQLVLTWSGGTLEAAEDLTGQWSAVPGATSPYTASMTGERKFFRVRVQ